MKLNFNICKNCKRCRNGWSLRWSWYEKGAWDKYAFVLTPKGMEDNSSCKFDATELKDLAFTIEDYTIVHSPDTEPSDDEVKNIFSRIDVPERVLRHSACPFALEHLVLSFSDEMTKPVD